MTDDSTPWYRQFWPWFILSPLIFVVIAGFSMIYLAVITSDGAVIDNYYKDGLTIVERTEQDEWAANNNLSAQLQSLGEQVQLRLHGDLPSAPETLTLRYVFSTQASRDTLVTLRRAADGRYLGSLPEAISGRRGLLLEPAGGNQPWRLHGEATLPSPTIVQLLPKVE